MHIPLPFCLSGAIRRIIHFDLGMNAKIDDGRGPADGALLHRSSSGIKVLLALLQIADKCR